MSETPESPAPRGCLASVRDLLDGATCPPRALAAFSRHPHLRKYVAIPLLVNITVGAVLYGILLMSGFQWIDATIAGLPEWATVFEVVLRLLLVVILLFVLGFVLLRFGVVLGSPWYSTLSEHLEHLQGCAPPSGDPLSLKSAAREIWLTLSFEVHKLLLFIGVAVPLLLAEFIPFAGPLITGAGFLALSATILCLDFLDAPLARRKVTFRQRLRLIFGALPASASFGLVCVALVWVPLLNLLAIPVCVAGGTIFYCRHIRKEA